MKHPSTSIIYSFLIGLFVLLGCTDDGSSSDNKIEFKRNSNEVVARLVGPPDRLNPLLTIRTYSKAVLYQTHSYLLFQDLETYKMVPQLAKALPITEETTTGPNKGEIKYSFEIFEEAVWDNGTPITANDVIFTWKGVLFPGLTYAEAYRDYMFFIKDVEIDPQNPKKFTVIAKEKYFYDIEVLGGLMPIMPEYAYDPEQLLRTIPISTFTQPEKIKSIVSESEELKKFAEHLLAPELSHDPNRIVGSGPYKLEKWEQGQDVILVKKENWWGKELGEEIPSLRAYPDRIVFKPIPNAATALAALKAEEIDVIPRIDAKDFFEIQDEQWIKDHYNLEEHPMLAVFYLYINNQKEKFKDKRVRKAMAYATDVDAVIENIYYGYGQRTTGVPLPSFEYYNNDLPLINYDPDQAKSLLADAGWKDSNNDGTVDKEINGEIVELTVDAIYPANRESTQNTMQLIKNTMQTAGIGLNLVPVDPNQISARLRRGDFDLASRGTTIQPVWEPYQGLHSNSANGGSNYSRFINDSADKLIETIRVTIDEQERNQMYKELQALVYDEQPMIFFFNPINTTAIHKRFDADMTAIPPGFFPNRFKLKEEFRK